MPRFVYKAKISPGKIKEGIIEAENQNQAALKLSKSGLFILSVEEESSVFIKESRNVFRLLKSVPLRDISNFTRQLSNLLDAGLTMLNALGILINQSENPYLRHIIGVIRDDIKGGATFSAALSKHPKVFSELYVNMAESGEISGSLEDVLSRLSDFMEKDEENISRIRSSMAYPALMAFVGFITIFVLLSFVAPRLILIFIDLGQSLPLPTIILIGVSSFFARFWVLILTGLVFFTIVLYKWSKTQEGKALFDNVKLRIPLIGPFIKKAEVARFARTLAVMIGNGVSITQSLAVSGATIENTLIKKDIQQARRDVSEGASLSSGINKSKIFPPMAANMIFVGEESGTLERSLMKIANAYEIETDRTVKVITSLLEPTLILFMGIVVGFIVIAMLLPIFQLNLMAR
jgi:general secretion pathway protein F